MAGRPPGMLRHADPARPGDRAGRRDPPARAVFDAARARDVYPLAYVQGRRHGELMSYPVVPGSRPACP